MNDWSSIVHLVLAGAISAPLLYAGTSKTLDPSRFATMIPKFGIGVLPATLASARSVGTLEVAAGAASIVLPVAPTAFIAGCVYVCLALLVAWARMRGSAGDCGCFGVLGGQIDEVAVVRNLMFAVAALGLAYGRTTELGAVYEPKIALIALVAIVVGAAVSDTILAIRRLTA